MADDFSTTRNPGEYETRCTQNLAEMRLNYSKLKKKAFLQNLVCANLNILKTVVKKKLKRK